LRSSLADAVKSHIENGLIGAKLKVPTPEETEPQYTGRVLIPFVKSLLYKSASSSLVFIKGDGAGLRAVPVTFLENFYYPDISVEEDGTHYWACEVKLLNSSEMQDALPRALGQALIYRQRYLATTVVVIERPVRQSKTENSIIGFDANLNIIIIRNFENPASIDH